MAQVKLFGNLKQYSGSTIVTQPGATVGEVLRGLINCYPALESAIFEDGRLKPHVNCMVMGRNIELIDGMDTMVDENDVIAIFPPIAGGSELSRMRLSAFIEGGRINDCLLTKGDQDLWKVGQVRSST